MPKVLINREAAMVGSAVNLNCFINNDKVCKLPENAKTIIDLNKGIYKFYCNLSLNPKSGVFDIDLENNDYAEITVKQGMLNPKVKIEYKEGNSQNMLQTETQYDKCSKFNTTKKIGNYILLDEDKKQWAIPDSFLGKIQNSKVYNYSDIIEYELLQDGTSITKGGLGRAVAGGLLFGGIGAIVGGVTGTRKTKELVNNMQIKITLNDISNPVIYIKLILSPTKTNSIVYKVAKQYAEQLLSVFSIIQNEVQSSNSQSKKQEESVNLNSLDITGEIKKYKELLDLEAITQEEYDKKKKELLNI